MKKTYNDCFSGFSYENPHVISYRNKRRGELVGKVIVLMLIIGVISVTSLARYASPLLGIPVFLVLAGLLFKPWRLFDRRFAGRIVSIAHEHCRESINKSSVDIRYVNQHVVAYMVCLVKGERRKNYSFRIEEKYEEVYHVGAFIMKIPGIDFPINLTAHDLTVCPGCGALYPRENKQCVGAGCGMPAVIVSRPVPQIQSPDKGE